MALSQSERSLLDRLIEDPDRQPGEPREGRNEGTWHTDRGQIEKWSTYFCRGAIELNTLDVVQGRQARRGIKRAMANRDVEVIRLDHSMSYRTRGRQRYIEMRDHRRFVAAIAIAAFNLGILVPE